jgi:hypothetical protein
MIDRAWFAILGLRAIQLRAGGCVMKAIEFQSELRADHTLSVPANIAERIPCGQTVRVLVLVPEDLEDQDWEQLATAEFGMGYADSDAIYDHLSNR